MNTLRQQAELLRAQGYSYTLIHQKLGVSKGTMSYWFKDKPFTPNDEVLSRIKNGPAQTGIKRHNQRVQEIKALREQGIRELGTLSQRDLWLLGLGVYIGEGSKTTEMIRITNSDPDIIRLSVRWFKEVCNLTDDNLSVRIHIYPDNDPDECIAYWQTVTGLNRKNFRKVSVDLRTDKRVSRAGKLPYGTAHMTVLSNGDPSKGVRLFRRINGWIAGAVRPDITDVNSI